MLRLIKAASTPLQSIVSRSLRTRAIRVFNTQSYNPNPASRSRGLCTDKRAGYGLNNTCNHHINHVGTIILKQHPIEAQSLDQDLRRHRYVHFYTYKKLRNMNLVRKTKKLFVDEWGKLGVLGR